VIVPSHPRPLSYLPETKRELLGALKMRTEGATCEALADATGISLSSARAQLMSLSSEGLVERTPLRGGPGRPEFSYRLSEQAGYLFARQNDALAIELLATVGAVAPDTLRKAIDARTEHRIQEKQRTLAGSSPEERIRKLAGIFEEEGFVVVVSSPLPADLRLSIRHCPLRELAAVEPYICVAEERYLASLLPGAVVSSTANINRGADECCFRIRSET